MQRTLVNKISFLKYCAAIFYDALLCLSLLMIATFVLMPITNGQAIPANNIYFKCYLITFLYLFFSQYWCRAQQTLGMRAWKIKIVNHQGQKITQQQALIRFVGAIISFSCFGLGFFWQLFNKQNKTWHDLLSKTQLHKTT